MANMARALDKKDDFINQLEHRIQDMQKVPIHPIELEENHHLKHEVNTLKNENRLLRDKIASIDFDRSSRERVPVSETENRRLRAEL